MTTTERQRQYLEAMGVEVWVERSKATALPAVRDRSVAYVSVVDPTQLDWAALETRVEGCMLCELHVTRTRTVFGVGNRAADWMIIGEAPGAEEDRQGEPFVGRAGLLLNEMLFAIGLNRDAVYIANILKCRPPGNRDPRPDEILCCEPYLRRQVALVSPRIILAVGRVAAQNLLKSERKVGDLRGRIHRYADTGIPLVVTYHPAYLLRSPRDKRKAWQDLCLARQVIHGGDPGG